MKEIYRTILSEWKIRNIPRTIARDINLVEFLDSKPEKIIVITGFRRVGKTSLLFNFIEELLKKENRERVLYINFEDERIPLKTEFLTNLLPFIKKEFKDDVKLLFLDEIQNIPGWSKWLRRIYDTENIRIFVTGSSSKMSSKEIPTELRGRFLEINLDPLSFREFLHFKNIELSEIYSETNNIKVAKLLRDYLEFGGMPEVVLGDETRREELIHNYYNTVIRRDIIERFKIRNEGALKALLGLLLNSTSFSISKMYNTLKSLNIEVGKGTIQSYLSYIENSYFLYSLPMFSFKLKDQLQYPRKIYLADNGFITTLTNKKNWGRLYENAVFLELKKTGKELGYWKNTQKEEVDFVVKDKNKVKGLIQVCYDIEDYDTRNREIRALLKASAELKCNKLWIISEDKEKIENIKGKKVTYIPLWKWLLRQPKPF